MYKFSAITIINSNQNELFLEKSKQNVFKVQTEDKYLETKLENIMH